jgi:hypothetical protein
MERRRLAVGAVGAVLGVSAAVVLADSEDRSCERQIPPVTVTLPEATYPHIRDHAADAIRAGQPDVLHIAREEAEENRAASLRGVPTRKGYDRDEYPPAMSDEGGRGASVRYVLPRENRSAGATMGRQLRIYCDGQAFVIGGN